MGYGATDGCRPTSDYYYGDRERGWFYSESPCVQVDQNATQSKSSAGVLKKKYKLIPKKVEIPWDIIDEIDPEEIAKMERDSQKIAIMYPTDHNVKEHRLLQRYVVKKSVAYAKSGDRLGRSDTELAAWRSEVPNSAFKRDVKSRELHKKSEDVLWDYSQKAGLVVITQPNCVYCEKQIPILNMLKQETGFTYKEVDMTQAPAIVTKLGVARTPDIFLVFNKNGKAKWQRVASGLNSLDEMKQAVLMGLYELGELKDDLLIYNK
jgi:conjugal transfer pilus assembly protein TraF